MLEPQIGGNNIASTILEQLGNNRFIVMTGSHNFVSDGNSLRMNLRRNNAKARQLQITLQPSDTYTMDFYTWNSKTLEIKHIAVFKNVYADMLQKIFTQVTGFDTHL